MKTKFIAVSMAAFLFAVSANAGQLGDKAAPLQIAQWVKGQPVDLAAGMGKTVYVVEFWATWCGPCKVSIPHLTEMQRKFKDKGVVFIGVSSENPAKVKPFVQRMGSNMDYTVAVDNGGRTSSAYMSAFGQGGIPCAFVINQKGNIVWVGHPMGGLDKVVERVAAGNYDLALVAKEARASKLVPQYFALAKRGDANARKLGEQIIVEAGSSPQMMNEFAWTLLTDAGIQKRDLDLALRAAKAAYDACDGQNAAILDTYAKAFWDTGKKAEAIEFQQKAIALCTNDKDRVTLNATLQQYLNAK